jgi:hypothetical protein
MLNSTLCAGDAVDPKGFLEPICSPSSAVETLLYLLGETNIHFEEALDFDTGKSIEHWVAKYWESMMTLEEYLEKRPYEKPEISIFESVPKEIIQVCET